MQRKHRLSTAQRVVLVVALGFVFLAVGSFLTSLGQPGFPTGWVGFAPLSTVSYGRPAWVSLVVWLVLTCIWAAVSIRLLRPAAAPEEAD